MATIMIQTTIQTAGSSVSLLLGKRQNPEPQVAQASENERLAASHVTLVRLCLCCVHFCVLPSRKFEQKRDCSQPSDKLCGRNTCYLLSSSKHLRPVYIKNKTTEQNVTIHHQRLSKFALNKRGKKELLSQTLLFLGHFNFRKYQSFIFIPLKFTCYLA